MPSTRVSPEQPAIGLFGTWDVIKPVPVKVSAEGFQESNSKTLTQKRSSADAVWIEKTGWLHTYTKQSID